MSSTLREVVPPQIRDGYGVKEPRSGLPEVPGAQLLPIRRARLGEQVGHVRLDRAGRQEELLGDRRIRQPGLEQPKYVELAAGHAEGAQVRRYHRVATTPSGPSAGAAEQFATDPAQGDVSFLLVRGQVSPQLRDGIPPAVRDRRLECDQPQEAGPPWGGGQ